MGTSTSAARVGSFLSPYIVYSVSLEIRLVHQLLIPALSTNAKLSPYIVLLIRFTVADEAF